MTITLNVLNYSNNTSNAFIRQSVNGFLDELMDRGVDIKTIQVEYNDDAQYKMVKRFIDKLSNTELLIDNFKFLEVLNEYYLLGQRFVIIGEDIPTKYPWGDARVGFVTVVKRLLEKNIWHETAHVIGADDHYDLITKNHIDKCKDNNCIMRYGRSEGILCDCTIEEIKVHLNKSNK